MIHLLIKSLVPILPSKVSPCPQGETWGEHTVFLPKPFHDNTLTFWEDSSDLIVLREHFSGALVYEYHNEI
jgi:hypothetical protein